MQYTIPQKNSDSIDDLPSDTSTLTVRETDILNSIFKQPEVKHSQSLTNDLNNLVIVIVLFVCINIPGLDTITTKYIPITGKSPYFLLLFKTLVFTVLYYILVNYRNA